MTLLAATFHEQASHQTTAHQQPIASRWVAIGLCWVLVACSLTRPAFVVEWPQGTLTDYPSLGIFLFGWLGMLEIVDGNVQMIAWLANPLFFWTSALLAARLSRAALITGLLSVLAACLSVLLKSAIMNEAGHVAPVAAFASGFYLWFAAISGQALLAVVSWMTSPRTTSSSPQG